MTGKTNAKKAVTPPASGGYTLTVYHMGWDDTLPEYIYISFDDGATWTSFDETGADGRGGSEWANTSSFKVYYDAQGNALADVLYTLDGNMPEPFEANPTCVQHSMLGADSPANAITISITADTYFIVTCVEQ